jgi:hypothetical protein
MFGTRPTLIGLLVVLGACAAVPAYVSAAEIPWASGGEKLEEGLRLNIESSKAPATGNAKLEGTLAGVTVVVECEEEHGGGWVENSTTTKTGLSSNPNHYLKCKVTAPSGQNCLISKELILFAAHDLLTLSGEKVRDEFLPESGTVLTTIHMDNCTTTALNGSFNVTGRMTAEVNNEKSYLEFSSTSGSSLKFGGNAATFTDSDAIAMEGGGMLEGLFGSLVPNEKDYTYKASGEKHPFTIVYKGIINSGVIAGLKIQNNTPLIGKFVQEKDECAGKNLAPQPGGGSCTIEIKYEGEIGKGASGTATVASGALFRSPAVINLKA